MLAAGPRLGPAVLFWSYFVVIILAGPGLGRIPWTPLKTRHWLLLGLGLTQVHPLAAIMKVAKVENIAGGTMEACRLVIQRTAIRQMAEDLKMPKRVIHEELGVPVAAGKISGPEKDVDEDKLLQVLAEDYRVNPGLHMSRDDIKTYFDVDDEKLDELLMTLESKGFVKLNRDKRGIALQQNVAKNLPKFHSKSQRDDLP